MVTEILPIPESFSKEQIDELKERIPYLSEQIKFVSTNESKEIVIKLEDFDSKLKTDIVQNFDSLVDAITSWRPIKDRVLKSNSSTINAKAETEANISNFYNEDMIQLFEFFDQKILNISNKFSAELREYPTVLPIGVMQKSQYHIHFPQNLFAMHDIPHDYKVLHTIRSNPEQIEQAFRLRGYLQPCICYHCYEEWADKKMTAGIISAKGRCFRHELKGERNINRKTEFTMREIVFVGNQEAVDNLRDSIMDETWKLFNELGFTGKIVTASDPFYYSDELGKISYQKLSNTKYELKVDSNIKSASVAIASFNNCFDQLSRKFNIKNSSGDEFLSSGCVAFGLDRWVNTFITCYGTDKNQWPEPVKSMTF
ncbi:aminoacyl--tRNA ligase-related protein [Bacillus sp. MUM 13]|uniref:aminoacyl--tRNA ligase-related protein n=1 Tax=Bacillus sp. MUM 13 TaxID=1678001 RepID=UPI0008F5CC91|nr:aminoacyl--tRNA ligase-related protein [Bacillus sp. MUM 13]OIK06807.1 hypothetical protein BIV59_21295 [Bacillus sp. MUM 13]